MKNLIISPLRYTLSLVFFVSIAINSFSSTQKSTERYNHNYNDKDKKELILKAHANAELFDKGNKTKKAITELENILTLAESLNEEALLERTYELLWQFNKKANNKKKTVEYSALYNLTKTTRENKSLEEKNSKTEQLLNKSTNDITTLKKEKVITAHVIDSTNHQLLVTKDSLGILDLINRNKQGEIILLNKEKQLKDLKVKEQALLIKEEEALQRFTWVLVGSLVLGIITLSTLAFFIYKNLQQKKKHNVQQEVQLQLIQHQHDNITMSINYAQRIQNSMLPHQSGLAQFIPDSFILFKPKDIVSGDFYWIYNTETGEAVNELDVDSIQPFVQHQRSSKIIIAAVDCTGHGVPGAFMSMIGFNLLNTIVSKDIHEPHLILSELNKGVHHALQQHRTENKDGMDMAICSIDKINKTIEFAGAKNPMIVIKNGELEVIKGDKDAIGGSQGGANRTYTKHTITIDQPTTIYLLSDGYEDQFGGPEGKKFMIKTLRELLLKIHQEPFEQQKEILNQTIEAWKGRTEKQIDDILLMGMRVE